MMRIFFSSAIAVGAAAQGVPVHFKESPVRNTIVSTTPDFVPAVPKNPPSVVISLHGLKSAVEANPDHENITLGSDAPVCKTLTDTTTIEGCDFKTETTIYCSAQDTWGGVKVTEKSSGESIETDTTHCDGDSDCTEKMTKLAEEAIAYLYKYSLGATVSQVKDGVCSCGTQSTTFLGETFDLGICLTFNGYSSLEKEDASFKAYALGDRDPSHVGYTYDFNCKDEGYGDNITACATAVGSLAVMNSISAAQMSGVGGVFSTGDYAQVDVFAGAADDDNDKVEGDGPTQCPYGFGASKVGYFVEKGGDKGKLYLCTIKDVTSDPLGGFGGMYQAKADRRRQLRAENRNATGDAEYANPWTGSTSCPDGFHSQNTFRIELWDDDKGDKGYIHMCLRTKDEGPAGLIAGGYQSSDNDSCDKANYYTGEKSCPSGYKDKKIAKGNCGSDSSEMYICYNENQL